MTEKAPAADAALGQARGARIAFPDLREFWAIEKREAVVRFVQTPLGKLGGDTDLMGPALLLASDAGGHITGQTLAVDGGVTII